MRRRTSASGLLVSMNLRTASRSWSCSSENAKFTVVPLSLSWLSRLAREPKHPLADDVALDFAGAGVDGLGPAEHEDAVQFAELVATVGFAAYEHRVGAEDPDRALTEGPVPGAPVELADARLGTEYAAVHEAREHAHAVELHDLDADVGVGER